MCGIVGVFVNSSDVSLSELTRVVSVMTDALVHRGPDDKGVWLSPEHGLGIGHRRLSILDLSAAGHQPMHSICGRYVIVFNGEIYNHLELRSQLKNTVWRGSSDTETILAYFCEHGLERTLGAIKGMFAFAIWDKHRSELLLARDRFGEKPLYYGWQNGDFIFGSELKALKAYSNFSFTIDRQALAQYVRYNYVPAPYSIYNNVYKLKPGHFIKVSRGAGLEAPRCYWDIASVARAARQTLYTGSLAEAATMLEQKLITVLQGQSLADVPVGALLSGGIDSSLVVALMQHSRTTAINTFTIGFDNKNFNEAQHAKAVARHIGSDHTELYLSGSHALNLIPELPRVYDEPFADSSQLPTLLLMQLAQKTVSVALSGDGADEIFGGYNRYIFGPQVSRQFGGLSLPSRKLLAKLLSLIKAEQLNNLSRLWSKNIGVAQIGDKAYKLAACLPYAGTIDGLYDALVSQWREDSVVKSNAELDLGHINAGLLASIQDDVSRMMLLDSKSYLPDDILVKVDRAAMSVSLETRAPYLDHDLAEFAWSLPNSYKVSGGVGKILLRELLYRHVPKGLIDRPKVGFSVPLDEWLRGPLRPWAEALLAPQRLEREGYFKPAPIRQAWTDHLRGNASNGYKLWSILMFQAWLEVQG